MYKKYKISLLSARAAASSEKLYQSISIAIIRRVIKKKNVFFLRFKFLKFNRACSNSEIFEEKKKRISNGGSRLLYKINKINSYARWSTILWYDAREYSCLSLRNDT